MSTTTLPAKSQGHIGFIRAYPGAPLKEMFSFEDSVFIAPLDNVIDVTTGRRSGRWECKLDRFERFRELYSFEPEPEPEDEPAVGYELDETPKGWRYGLIAASELHPQAWSKPFPERWEAEVAALRCFQEEPEPESFIQRTQLTSWDLLHHPEKSNPEYLEYSMVSTGLSSEAVAYGYRRVTPLSDGTQRLEWITKVEAGKASGAK